VQLSAIALRCSIECLEAICDQLSSCYDLLVPVVGQPVEPSTQFYVSDEESDEGTESSTEDEFSTAEFGE